VLFGRYRRLIRARRKPAPTRIMPPMTAPRFYCPDLCVGQVALSEAEARHARASLRLQAGDELTLFDGRGGMAHGQLARAAGAANTARTTKKGRRATRLVATVEAIVRAPAATQQLTLIVAGCKGARLDWLVEKCTELGVTRLHFAEFARSVVHVGSAHLEKLRRTAVEACKQCGRLWLPEIAAGGDLVAVVTASDADHLLVADPAETARPYGTWLQHHAAGAHSIAAVVGPEGGLTADEMHVLMRAGAEPVCLGTHTLRVETAAVALAAAWSAALPAAPHGHSH